MWLADHMHAAPHAERLCVKGRPEEVDGVPSRFVTYDNLTIGAAAVRQLHKRARRGRPPARRGLSRYLPAILFFARSLFFLSRHLSRQWLGVNILFSGGCRRRRYV